MYFTEKWNGKLFWLDRWNRWNLREARGGKISYYNIKAILTFHLNLEKLVIKLKNL